MSVPFGEAQRIRELKLHVVASQAVGEVMPRVVAVELSRVCHCFTSLQSHLKYT